MSKKIKMSHLVAVLLSIFLCGQNALANEQLKPAERVITLAPHAFEIVKMLGAESRVIGVLEYPNMTEDEKQKPKVGGFHGLQIEKIIALKPDLIIAWESGNKLQEIERMESLGLPVYRSYPRRLSDIDKDLLEIGQRLGLSDKARQMQEAFRHQVERLTQKYMHRKPVRVFYQMWHQPLRTINDNSWIGQFILMCGGQNIFANAASEYPVVEKEAVILRDPQVILMSEGQVENKNIWLEWRQISAVKNEQFYYLPADNLHRATPRAVEGLRVVCEAIDKARQSINAKN